MDDHGEAKKSTRFHGGQSMGGHLLSKSYVDGKKDLYHYNIKAGFDDGMRRKHTFAFYLRDLIYVKDVKCLFYLLKSGKQEDDGVHIKCDKLAKCLGSNEMNRIGLNAVS